MRRYAADMLHPSSQAVDFVWTRVLKAYYEEVQAVERRCTLVLDLEALDEEVQSAGCIVQTVPSRV